MAIANKDKVVLIKSYFDEILPTAGCELEYNSDYGFLIAVMLSAQCTDKKVNVVTRKLFSNIENEIKSLGLYKNKAKNLKETVKILIEKYNGIVPKDKNELMKLPGVGNKTANVVRVELFKEQELPVDTHVFRVSKRLGLINENDDVLDCEHKLRKLFKGYDYILLHHQFIHFGRYFCKAMSPKCENCKLKGFCRAVKD